MHQVIKTFLELVSIDSPSGKEAELRNWLINWADKNHWHYQVDSVGNLVITKEAQDYLPFFFCAHMDTVQPGENIQPVIKSGTIQSHTETILGADNKASLAAIVTAIEDWSAKSKLGFQLLFTVKEETGGGVECLDQSLLRSKNGFIFDYAEPLGKIVMSAPFIINFHISVNGKSSHACFPEKGISVLPTLLKLLEQIPTGKLSEDTFVNVGTVTAGTTINTIPGQMTLSGEVRSFDKQAFTQTISQIEKIVATFNTGKIKAKFETSGYCAGYTHSLKNSSLQFLSAAMKTVKLETEYVKSFGISDANSLNDLGFNVVTASDGVKNPHTTREKIAVKDLIKLYQLVESLLKAGSKRHES